MKAATPSETASPRIPRHLHRLLLALGGALVVLLLVSSAWQASASLKALSYLQQQSQRVERLDSLLIQMVDAENAVRGYLLSGNRAHLDPYDKTSQTAQQTLEAIRSDLGATPVNDDALADLSGLVAIKLRSLDQAVQRGIAGSNTGSQGKEYTDRIRATVLGLEKRLAAEGRASFERSTGHVERTRWVVGMLAAGALALMGLMNYVLDRQFRLRSQIACLLHSENQRLDALVQERTAELSDLASYLTNAREAEKARLARELHDELGALLTAAKMEANQVAERIEAAARATCGERLARLSELLDRGIALKRRIIDGLRPPFLEELGLVSTLRALGEEFSRDGKEALKLELPDGDVNLAPAPALALFRITQEALTNIRRHAHAKRVTLALRVAGERLELEIADDGVGFPTGAMRRRHHGLNGMKHRVQMCAGDFSLLSRPGTGTRIRVRIPLAPAIPVQEGVT
jgi:signal transduction histidine kinase